MTALQQTTLVNMWFNRQNLVALDQAEQQQLGEEAEAIAEMQETFKKAVQKGPSERASRKDFREALRWRGM